MPLTSALRVGPSWNYLFGSGVKQLAMNFLLLIRLLALFTLKSYLLDPSGTYETNSF